MLLSSLAKFSSAIHSLSLDALEHQSHRYSSMLSLRTKKMLLLLPINQEFPKNEAVYEECTPTNKEGPACENLQVAKAQPSEDGAKTLPSHKNSQQGKRTCIHFSLRRISIWHVIGS